MEFRTNIFSILIIILGFILLGSIFLPMMHNLPTLTKLFGAFLGIMALMNGVFSLNSSPWSNYLKQLAFIIILGIVGSTFALTISCIGGALIVGIVVSANAVLHLGIRNDAAHLSNLWGSGTILTAMLIFCYFIVRDAHARIKRPR